VRNPWGKITIFDYSGAGTSSGQGTLLEDINDAGEISGAYVDGTNAVYALLLPPNGNYITFEAPGAGTGYFQGTHSPTFYALTPAGETTGWYIDGNNCVHGWVRNPKGKIATFDGPKAACATGGAWSVSLNPEGEATGFYFDANNVVHGFLRAPDGTIRSFDAPGAGTGSGQGTSITNSNPAGAIAGNYVDANNVNHGFEYTPGGTFITFEAPGAGTGAGQGTGAYGGINSAGVMTGWYTDENNVNHGFLRVPW
jgi:hypothetical protein